MRGIYGLPLWSEDEFIKNIKHSAREIYPKIYGDKAPEAMDTLYGYVMERHLDHLILFPHAEDLIMRLRDLDIPMGIVSNKRHAVIVREVEHLGWQDMFFTVMGAGQAARDKPAADPVVMALGKYKKPLAAANVWFVGDTETDLLAAQAAGCPAVLVTHGRDRRNLIDSYSPLVVADDCAALLQLFQGNKDLMRAV